MTHIIRISRKVVNEFNLNTPDLMVKGGMTYDLGFDKPGFETFEFRDKSITLNFIKSISSKVSQSTPAKKVVTEKGDWEVIIG